MYMSAFLVPPEARKGYWMTWNWSCRWFYVTMLVLGTKPRFLARTERVLAAEISLEPKSAILIR